jgi:hypothetical protein
MRMMVELMPRIFLYCRNNEDSVIMIDSDSENDDDGDGGDDDD